MSLIAPDAERECATLHREWPPRHPERASRSRLGSPETCLSPARDCDTAGAVPCPVPDRARGGAPMPRMTGGEAAVQALLAQGVDTLFVLPGVQNDALFSAL